MRGGVFLIGIALVLAYIGVTGRYKCAVLFFSCLWDASCADNCACRPNLSTKAGSIPGTVVAPDGATIVKPLPGEPPTVYDPTTRQPVYDATTPRLLPIEPFV